MVHDLREVLLWAKGHAAQPTAAIFDSATRPSTPEREHRAGDRAQVEAMAAAVQEATGSTGELALGDQGQGIRLEVMTLPVAKPGFLLLPRRWVAERAFAWAARFRRLATDDERLPEIVAGLHFVAFPCPQLHRLINLAAQSP